MEAHHAPLLITPAEAFALAVTVLRTQSNAAKLLGCTQGAISKRLAAKSECRDTWVLKLEAATAEAGTPVSRYLLRPDLYQPAPTGDHLPVSPATGAVPAAPPADTHPRAAGGPVSEAPGQSPAAPPAGSGKCSAGGPDLAGSPLPESDVS